MAQVWNMGKYDVSQIFFFHVPGYYGLQDLDPIPIWYTMIFPQASFSDFTNFLNLLSRVFALISIEGKYQDIPGKPPTCRHTAEQAHIQY